MNKSLTAALLGIGLLASPATFAAEKTVTLAVSGMDCSACPITVKSKPPSGTGRLQGRRFL